MIPNQHTVEASAQSIFAVQKGAQDAKAAAGKCDFIAPKVEFIPCDGELSSQCIPYKNDEGAGAVWYFTYTKGGKTYIRSVDRGNQPSRTTEWHEQTNVVKS